MSDRPAAEPRRDGSVGKGSSRRQGGVAHSTNIVEKRGNLLDGKPAITISDSAPTSAPQPPTDGSSDK